LDFAIISLGALPGVLLRAVCFVRAIVALLSLFFSK
jgi:hypothetical protein